MALKGVSYRAIKLPTHQAAILLKQAMGLPTPEKVQKVLAAYNEASHRLIGCYYGKEMVGIIGLGLHPPVGVIKHLAVDKAYRHQGIGQALVQEAINRFPVEAIQAETDEEAVGFYQKCGFACGVFEGPYGRRYRCQKRVP